MGGLEKLILKEKEILNLIFQKKYKVDSCKLEILSNLLEEKNILIDPENKNYKITEIGKEALKNWEKNLGKNIDMFQNEILSIEDAHKMIVKIFKRYIDMKEENYSVVATWILGAKIHDFFETFPYFYLNAMKGSGKTRFLKLVMFLIDGFVTTNVTEAVLFREKTPIAIDEAETISSKENSNKHDLLNSGYKKGNIVKRVERNHNGEFETKGFDPYRPINIANIDGLDDVLEDRCVKIILEKSFNKEITRRMEIFHLDPEIMKVHEFLQKMNLNNSFEIKNKYFNICVFLMGLEKPELSEQEKKILDRIEKTSLLGRDLELWMPIFVVASSISEKVLDDIFHSAIYSAEKRQENNIFSNKDVVLVGFLNDFISGRDEKDEFRIKDLVDEFSQLNGEEEWFSPEWLGRALVRNILLKSKRRLGRGIEVRLNFEKIKMKARQFGLVKDLTGWNFETVEGQKTLK